MQLITLVPGADAKDAQSRLQALGLWTIPVQSEHTGHTALLVEPHSRQLPSEVLREVPGVADVWAAPSPHPKVDAQAHRPIVIGGVRMGQPGAPVIMAGPCSVESATQIAAAAALVARAGGHFLRGGAFKPRTSPYSFAGHGEPALRWLRDAADAHGLKVVTEVMSELHVAPVAAHADLLQVGMRNMQNFALLKAVGATGKPVLLKRALSATMHEWLMAGEHLLAAGASAVVFCERGIQGFDPATRNLLDLGAVALMRHVYRQPIVVDPSHATGRRDLIPPLSRAAIAAGADGLLVEVHPDTASARSDGAQALDPAEFEALIASLGITVSAQA
ncbi:MAG: 3-deoxy-7-phosphoheptulonate synthase [Planctomycetota bacterium]